MRSTVDDFWLIEGGTLRVFDGDLDDYTQYSQDNRNVDTRRPGESGEQVDRKALKRQEAETRQRLSAQRKPLEQRLGKIDKELAQLTATHAALTAQLADQSIYALENKAVLQDALLQEAQAKQRIESLELEWLEVTEALEALQA